MSLDTHQHSPTPPRAQIAALPASTKNADVINAITVHHTTLVNEMRTLTAGARKELAPGVHHAFQSFSKAAQPAPPRPCRE